MDAKTNLSTSQCSAGVGHNRRNLLGQRSAIGIAEDDPLCTGSGSGLNSP